MNYYCNICKKTISIEEYQFSINKYRIALCKDHQLINKISSTTKDLQNLVRDRHKHQLKTEIPKLKTIKDWINADFDTWDKTINKVSDGQYIIKISEADKKHSYSKRKKDKDNY